MTDIVTPPDADHLELRELVARSVGEVVDRSVVVVERGPVAAFADAIVDPHPAYRTPTQARALGFSALPAPPTFAAALEHWGRFYELQPESLGVHPLVTLLGRLLAAGGSLFHAGQEFTYGRPVVVGDVLSSETTMVDGRVRRAMAATLTFLTFETTWSDQGSGETVLVARATVVHRR